MDTECISGKTVIGTKESGELASGMEMAQTSLKMVTNILANTSMETPMDTANINGQMAILMLASLRMD